MEVKIKALFTHEDLKQVFKQSGIAIEEETLTRFAEIGKEFVEDARTRGAYMNHSWELRSSIACEVLRNGKSVYKNYQLVGDGKRGVADAKKLIAHLKTQYSKGIALIVVAAEKYAGYVEAKGKNVLTLSGDSAISDLRNFLR